MVWAVAPQTPDRVEDSLIRMTCQYGNYATPSIKCLDLYYMWQNPDEIA